MGSTPTRFRHTSTACYREPLKTQRFPASSPPARARKRSPPVGHSQKDSQKELRLEVVGSEIRSHSGLVAAACDECVAKRIAEALTLTAGLSWCRCGGESPPRGLLSSIVAQSDELVRVVFDAIDSPGKTLGQRRSKLRTLAQGYVELRGWLATARQREMRERTLMNARVGKRKRRAQRRSPFGDILEADELEESLEE